MQIVNDISLLSSYKDVVLTIGSFDGVHSAHQKIIRKLTAIADEIKGVAMVVSFQPHPRTVIDPDFKFTIITTFDERSQHLEQLGVNVLLNIPFTQKIANQSYLDFIRFLVHHIDIHTIVLGYNHHFGKNREGNAELLKIKAEAFNFRVVEVERVIIDSLSVSSTLIRKKMVEGKIAEVNSLLGYTYKMDIRIEKEIIKNHKFQISLLNPTKILPIQGVYTVQIKQDTADLYITENELSLVFHQAVTAIKITELYNMYFI